MAKSGKIKTGLSVYSFVLAAVLFLCGVFYLYQVNAIATKSYEIKEMENKVQELQKENKKLKIREVERKSMYNIEKATENFDLVNSTNISYLEIHGPMAMK